ncbi:MAG: ABC transporter permease [Thermodesulfovibrionia bacterium]|nr:ABC transporter permease [Thermodesulfovibrionia bacterium]
MNIKRAYRVFQRNFTVYTKRYKSSLVLNFFEPIIYLAALGLGLGAYVKEIKGVPYINYLAPGLIASSSMFAATFECTYGTYIRMTFQKTFDAILVTPVNISDLVLGELLWGAAKGTFYGIIIMTVLSFMGLLGSALIVTTIPAIFISSLIFAEIALIVTSIVPGIDSFNYFNTLLMTPMFLFSGIFFPIDNMPAFVSKVAFFSPLYHLVNICRSFSSGEISPVMLDMAWLTVLALILLPYPFRLLRKRIIK